MTKRTQHGSVDGKLTANGGLFVMNVAELERQMWHGFLAVGLCPSYSDQYDQ